MATTDNTTDDLHLNKALEHLKSVLVAGETLDAWAIQRKLFALTHRRILIAATSGRFIQIKRGLLGGFEMTDFRWQDLGDAKIKVGIFGADVFMKIFGSTDLAISKDSNQVLVLPGFRKEQAEQIFEAVPAMFNREQQWAAGASHLPNKAGLIYKVVGMESQIVRAKIREFWELVRRTVMGTTLPPEFLWR